MNFLHGFSAVLAGVDKATPLIGAINPGAGLLVGSIIHGIFAVQSILPGAEHNDVKKSIVTAIADATSAQVGVTLTPDQTSALIENLLQALKNSAAVPAAAAPAIVPKK